MSAYALRAAVVVAEEEDVPGGELMVEGDRLVPLRAGAVSFDLGDCTIIPGLIDIHIHGRDGRDVMDGDRQSLRIISRSLARHGVTGFLATTVTASWERTVSALETIGNTIGSSLEGAQLLGAYSEGLFFSEKYKGAHNSAFFLEPTVERIEAMLTAAKGALKVVALAPERAHALDVTRFAVAHGIRIVIGHTDATYEEAVAALQAGASGGVHVFNGMRGIHHREPGCAGAVLLNRATVEVIADGVHLHPAILSLIVRLKSLQDIILISDCMCAGGLPDGRYRLGEVDVNVAGTIARTEEGSLAGSTLTLERAVTRMSREGGISLRDAVHLASLSPARFLGLDGVCGSIAPGKRADLAIVDAAHGVRATIVGGRLAWCDPSWERAAGLAAMIEATPGAV